MLQTLIAFVSSMLSYSVRVALLLTELRFDLADYYIKIAADRSRFGVAVVVELVGASFGVELAEIVVETSAADYYSHFGLGKAVGPYGGA